MRLDHLLSARKVILETGQPASTVAIRKRVSKPLGRQCLPTHQSSRTLLPAETSFPLFFGGLAQLARASALQAEGQGFESLNLQSHKHVKRRVRKDPAESGLSKGLIGRALFTRPRTVFFETNRDGSKQETRSSELPVSTETGGHRIRILRVKRIPGRFLRDASAWQSRLDVEAGTTTTATCRSTKVWSGRRVAVQGDGRRSTRRETFVN